MPITTKPAVQCRTCGRLLAADGSYIIAKEMSLAWHSHGDKEVTKTVIRDEVFCGTSCLGDMLTADFG